MNKLLRVSVSCVTRKTVLWATCPSLSLHGGVVLLRASTHSQSSSVLKRLVGKSQIFWLLLKAVFDR